MFTMNKLSLGDSFHIAGQGTAVYYAKGFVDTLEGSYVLYTNDIGDEAKVPLKDVLPCQFHPKQTVNSQTADNGTTAADVEAQLDFIYQSFVEELFNTAATAGAGSTDAGSTGSTADIGHEREPGIHDRSEGEVTVSVSDIHFTGDPEDVYTLFELLRNNGILVLRDEG
jgi:hypothetical protein